MSRIGKIPVSIPEGVEVNITGNNIVVKGKLGSLSYQCKDTIKVSKNDNILVVETLADDKQARAMWGTTRAVLKNLVEGVSVGFTKSLEINGVGYKFEIAGNKLILSVGFSHKVELDIPSDLKIEFKEKSKNIINISGIDKQYVGEFAAKIRSIKKPEPYKGKGIKYVGEYIRRKAGKSGKK